MSREFEDGEFRYGWEKSVKEADKISAEVIAEKVLDILREKARSSDEQDQE